MKNPSKTDEQFMKLALKEAQKAKSEDEVPVGAIVVCDGKVIATGYNKREGKKDPTAHAELIAIRKAAKKLGGWRTLGCTLYVTLEPCVMCAGAIINSRIPTVVFGAKDQKAGAFGSVYNVNEGQLNHTCEVREGVLQDKCSEILTDYFLGKRKEMKAKKKEIKQKGKNNHDES